MVVIFGTYLAVPEKPSLGCCFSVATLITSRNPREAVACDGHGLIAGRS